MFFAVADGLQALDIEQMDALADRIFGCNGFVSKIQANGVLVRDADDPGDDERCEFKGLFRQDLLIASVPENKCSGTDLNVVAFCMEQGSEETCH